MLPLIIVVTIAALCAGIDKPVTGALHGSANKGTCQCAVFQHTKPTGEPFIVKTPTFPARCDSEGASDCSKMCIALAEAARYRTPTAPEILCKTVGNLGGCIKPSVHSKVCDAPEWTYTGLTATAPICCADGFTIPCDETECQLEEELEAEEEAANVETTTEESKTEEGETKQCHHHTEEGTLEDSAIEEEIIEEGKNDDR